MGTQWIYRLGALPKGSREKSTDRGALWKQFCLKLEAALGMSFANRECLCAPELHRSLANERAASGRRLRARRSGCGRWRPERLEFLATQCLTGGRRSAFLLHRSGMKGECDPCRANW